MKVMKRRLLVGLILLIALGSCTKEGVIRRKEDKLIGAWEFEKVFYKGDHALFRKNITDEFEDDIMEFFSDYTAIYDDYSLGVVFDGEWSLIVEDIYVENASDLEFFIEAFFYDFLNMEEFVIVGGVDRLNRNKLHLTAYGRDGKYTFKLRRR